MGGIDTHPSDDQRHRRAQVEPAHDDTTFRPVIRSFRDLAKRMGFIEPCFEEDDATLCTTAYGDKVDFGELTEKGFATLHLPDAPFADGGSGNERVVPGPTDPNTSGTGSPR